MEQLDAVWTEQIRFVQWFSRLTDSEGREWEATLERDLESRKSSAFCAILVNHEQGRLLRSQSFFSPNAAMAWCYAQLGIQVD